MRKPNRMHQPVLSPWRQDSDLRSRMLKNYFEPLDIPVVRNVRSSGIHSRRTRTLGRPATPVGVVEIAGYGLWGSALRRLLADSGRERETARVGRVRSLAFLSILRECSPVVPCLQTIEV